MYRATGYSGGGGGGGKKASPFAPSPFSPWEPPAPQESFGSELNNASNILAKYKSKPKEKASDRLLGKNFGAKGKGAGSSKGSSARSSEDVGDVPSKPGRGKAVDAAEAGSRAGEGAGSSKGRPMSAGPSSAGRSRSRSPTSAPAPATVNTPAPAQKAKKKPRARIEDSDFSMSISMSEDESFNASLLSSDLSASFENDGGSVAAALRKAKKKREKEAVEKRTKPAGPWKASASKGGGSGDSGGVDSSMEDALDETEALHAMLAGNDPLAAFAARAAPQRAESPAPRSAGRPPSGRARAAASPEPSFALSGQASEGRLVEEASLSSGIASSPDALAVPRGGRRAKAPTPSSRSAARGGVARPGSALSGEASLASLRSERTLSSMGSERTLDRTGAGEIEDDDGEVIDFGASVEDAEDATEALHRMLKGNDPKAMAKSSRGAGGPRGGGGGGGLPPRPQSAASIRRPPAAEASDSSVSISDDESVGKDSAADATEALHRALEGNSRPPAARAEPPSNDVEEAMDETEALHAMLAGNDPLVAVRGSNPPEVSDELEDAIDETEALHAMLAGNDPLAMLRGGGGGGEVRPATAPAPAPAGGRAAAGAEVSDELDAAMDETEALHRMLAGNSMAARPASAPAAGRGGAGAGKVKNLALELEELKRAAAASSGTGRAAQATAGGGGGRGGPRAAGPGRRPGSPPARPLSPRSPRIVGGEHAYVRSPAHSVGESLGVAEEVEEMAESVEDLFSPRDDRSSAVYSEVFEDDSHTPREGGGGGRGGSVTGTPEPTPWGRGVAAAAGPRRVLAHDDSPPERGGHGRAAARGDGARDAFVQVGSWNEAGTQVEYDAMHGLLHAAPQSLADPMPAPGQRLRERAAAGVDMHRAGAQAAPTSLLRAAAAHFDPAAFRLTLSETMERAAADDLLKRQLGVIRARWQAQVARCENYAAAADRRGGGARSGGGGGGGGYRYTTLEETRRYIEANRPQHLQTA